MLTIVNAGVLIALLFDSLNGMNDNESLIFAALIGAVIWVWFYTRFAPTKGFHILIGKAIGGIPVSTTHTITGSIIGVSPTKGLASVRWTTATDIVGAWIVTIPATFVLSGLVYMFMGLFI